MCNHTKKYIFLFLVKVCPVKQVWLGGCDPIPDISVRHNQALAGSHGGPAGLQLGLMGLAHGIRVSWCSAINRNLHCIYTFKSVIVNLLYRSSYIFVILSFLTLCTNLKTAWCSVVQCSVVQCSVMQCSVTWCSKV